MADLVFILIVVAFFALCALYIRACEHIIQGVDEDAEALTEVPQ
jgi:hypothetical protein